MFKKTLAITMLSMLIVGCGEAERAEHIVDEHKQSSETSDTAIYLPGGGGLDFGLNPTRDETRTDVGGREFRIVTFLVNGSIEEVASVLAEVVAPQGYTMKELKPDASFPRKVVFEKEKNSILIRYGTEVSEGFKKETKILMSWYL